MGDIQKVAGSDVSPAPCCALWQLVAAVNPCVASQQSRGVAVKPFTHFYNEICMVLEASGGCCESIIDGLESRGSCCEANCKLLQININGFGSFRKLRESIIDGLESPGGCREAIYILLQININVFGSFRKLL